MGIGRRTPLVPLRPSWNRETGPRAFCSGSADAVNRVQSWFYARPGGAQTWRVGIALAGLLVIVVGIVLLAAPGPGWLIIFVGLGTWAMEFAWAKSLLRFVRRTVRTWTAWIGRQPRRLVVLVAAVGLVILGAVAAGAWCDR